MPKTKKEPLNPVTTHYEFSGIPGALAITLGLPAVIELFELICNENYVAQGVTLDFAKIAEQMPKGWSGFCEVAFDPTCWKVYLAWFFGLAVLDLVLPGQHLQGTELRDGTRLWYKINGKAMSSVLLTILAARLWQSDNWYLPELAFLYANQFKLIVTTVVFSFLMAIFVYVGSFVPLRKPNGVGTNERILSVGGNTGKPFYDWFIGRELNPRIGSWDIKLFCELRPGMLLWLLINLSCMHYQYHTHGRISDSMIIVNALQAFYIFDGVLNEAGVLSMMDITTDGFGFMLSFGDLAWVPWSYTLQARYLCLKENYLELGYGWSAAILAVMAVGFYIFRSANQQKSDFKNGKLDHLKSIPTPTGSRLLVDGWWSKSQHINYFGDWIIAWSWCLPTGFRTILTYFYVIYFGTLLVHRQVRDSAKCRAKYGKAWQEYERQVPWKIIPYVY
ncbi:delta(14)-sterol reductase Erg24p [Diutina catenulata]